MSDFLRLWKVFDNRNPSILSKETLQSTLLGEIGPSHGKNNVHYTLGVYVRQNPDGSSYSITHNGITDFYKRDAQFYAVAESQVPGGRWVLITSPMPDSDKRHDVPKAFREMVADYARSHN
jgi:hypothetical protein